MFYGPTPIAFTKFAFQQQKLSMAACEVVFRRMTALGAGQMSDTEAVSMVFEKPTAFAKGAERAAQAMVMGRGPLAATIEFYKPMTHKATSNAKRLRR